MRSHPPHLVQQSPAHRWSDERGVALVIALMSMLLLSALGIALMLTSATETRISGNYRDGAEGLYAADAAIERVIQDLLAAPDWNLILAGQRRSSFIDGAPGTRTLPAGGTLDLVQATNMVRCGRVTTCGTADMDAYTPERPWSANNPRWELYAYGPMEDMLPTSTINSPFYVVVWVGDDPSENDNNPLVDGNSETNMGTGVLSLLAHAYGPGGVRRVIEVTVARTDSTGLERGYTGQRGQDEQNRRARKSAVETPGKALTRSTLTVF